MEVLICSDLHIGHKLASQKRGFYSVEEHDEFILDTLNDSCGKRTILWVLGDVAMTLDGLRSLKSIQGRKILVKGNHDEYKLSEYIGIFENVHGIVKYKNMWMSHCPIHPQEMYRCKANIHGHIHKNTTSPELDLPYFNVNWDYHSRPLTLNEIKEIVGE